MEKKNKLTVKLASTLFAEIFTLLTIVKVLGCGQWDRILMAVVTLLIVLLPAGMEKLLRCRIAMPVYLFALFYAVGPMVGKCWDLYYTTCWWDKMLHIFGGIMFALVGAFLLEYMMQSKQKAHVTALFALIFSVAAAAVWEFVEFGSDCLLGMDSQADTFITQINSYLLGDQVGVTGTINGITSVTVNGTAMPGYIDIGLIDSMLDMLLESLGALITAGILWLDKGRHPWVTIVRKETVM